MAKTKLIFVEFSTDLPEVPNRSEKLGIRVTSFRIIGVLLYCKLKEKKRRYIKTDKRCFFLLYENKLYIHVTVLHRNRFLFLNNQPDALIIQIYSVIKFYMFRVILSAHHQEFPTVHSALVSFMQVFEDPFQAESG